MCCASTSSAPWRENVTSCSPASAASTAARHSSTSKRLDGTSIACEGSSSRWLERPMRWMKRLAPFGAPTWMTRSTSPQSMPRSRVEVATTARSEPSAIAASTLRRCSGVERAVMQGDGQAKIVDAPQVLEQQLGLHARVDEQQAEPVRLDRRVDLADGIARRVPDGRHRLVELENVDLRLGAADDMHEVGHARCATAARPAARDRRAAPTDAPPSPTDRRCAARAPACAAAPTTAIAGRRAWWPPARGSRRARSCRDRRTARRCRGG